MANEQSSKEQRFKVGETRTIQLARYRREGRIVMIDDEDGMVLVQFADFSSHWVTEEQIL